MEFNIPKLIPVHQQAEIPSRWRSCSEDLNLAEKQNLIPETHRLFII